MQKLTQGGIGFEKIDNAFVQRDDPAQAQRIANRFSKLRWPKILERYARLVNPLLHKELKQMSHYWVIDQAEFSTDLMFTSRVLSQDAFILSGTVWSRVNVCQPLKFYKTGTLFLFPNCVGTSAFDRWPPAWTICKKWPPSLEFHAALYESRRSHEYGQGDACGRSKQSR